MRSIITSRKYFGIIPILTLLTLNDFAKGEGLMCYQCERSTNTECSEKELLPCPPVSDQCVIHISHKDGYSIKRECGLGPCSFKDEMVNKALGLQSRCDIHKNNFCISCCKENGCNKSNSNPLTSPSLLLLVCIVAIVAMLNIHDDFQPPYVPKVHKIFL